MEGISALSELVRHFTDSHVKEGSLDESLDALLAETVDLRRECDNGTRRKEVRIAS